MPQEILIQGRIVRGHPAIKKPVIDDATKKQKISENGTPRENIYFGLAVEKSVFSQQYWPNFYQEALTSFPQGVPNNFAYKFIDGDTNDAEGKPYSRHPGYAGCFVINFSTEGFPPPIFKQDPAAPGGYRQMSPEEVSCGDYVAVTSLLKYNGNTGTRKPGLYVNPTAILFVGYGEKIASASVDPSEKFKGFQAQLPAGASATPLMSSAPMPSAMMPNAAPQYAPAPAAPQYAPAPAAPQYAPAPAAPQYAPAPAASGMPAPHTQFVADATGQPYNAPSNPNGYPGMPVGR